MANGQVGCGAPLGLPELLVPRRGEGARARLLVVALDLWLAGAVALLAGAALLVLRIAETGLVPGPAGLATAAVFIVFIWIVVAGALLVGVAHMRRPRA